MNRAEERTHKLWKTIDRVETTLGLNQGQIAEYLGLTIKDYHRSRMAKKKLSVSAAMELSQRLNISFEALITGDLDYRCLAKNYFSSVSALPEHYQSNAWSRRRTVIGILDAIETLCGWQRRALVMRRFQVNESMFSDPNAPINLNLSLDIANHFYRLGNDTNTLTRFGAHSVLTNRHGVVAKELADTTDYEEFYEKLVQETLPHYVERNYAWAISSTEANVIVISGTPNEILGEEMRKKPELHKPGCHIRGGFLAAAPGLVGLPGLHVRKTACVCDGDPSCEFELSTAPAMQQQSDFQRVYQA
jgi:predicted hydrocarbon binding protein